MPKLQMPTLLSTTRSLLQPMQRQLKQKHKRPSACGGPLLPVSWLA